MKPIVIRISNVLAWAAFTFIPFLLSILLLAILTLPSFAKYPCDGTARCYEISESDIDSTERLQAADAQAGDWVYQNKLIRKSPKWMTTFMGIFEDYIDDTLVILHLLFWLTCLIVNYIAVGSTRILPWKSISGERNPKS